MSYMPLLSTGASIPTDSVVASQSASTDKLKSIASGMSIAVNPVVVESKDMPSDLLAAEEEIYAAQARETGKPDKIIEKMVSGRLKKFLKENSLMDQPFVKDGDITVGELVKRHNVEVMCFERFEVGEGVTVEEVDFAAEVAEQLKNST